MDRSADNHYPTMSLEEIKALDVPSMMAPDVLGLFWATVPHMKNAFEILDAWGLEYKSMLTWDKVVAGTGKWFLNQTEHLILATRGNVPAPVEDQLISSLLREEENDALFQARSDPRVGGELFRTSPRSSCSGAVK